MKIGDKDVYGTLTDSVLDWLLEADYENETNIGSLVSGQAEVRATAIAAQTSADAAQQQATDVAAEALAFSGSISPSTAFTTRIGSGSATTNTVTASPTGGTGPYTYAWALVSGDTFTVTAPTSAATAFTGGVTLGGERSAIYRVTITDSLLATATGTVPVNIVEVS